MTLKNLFLETISTGLQRKTITTCSKWAKQYRVVNNPPYPGKWTFKYFPWLEAIHDSEADINVGQKSAQMGYTEAVLNIALFNIDIYNRDVLYVLPAQTPDASDFSTARFDPALESSPHISNLFSDIKNVRHKRGTANLYIRGSRSRSGLKSIPVGLIILDEVDEMTKENIPLAFERTSGQLEKFIWLLSTPTLENVGINKYYQLSSQNHFFFKCPACNRFTEFKYPDSLVVIGDGPNDPRVNESHLIDYQCGATLLHKDKVNYLNNNAWIESYTNRDSKGWHISQLYSSTVTPVEIALKYFASQSDFTEEQELFNSKLGLVHEVQGARVTDKQIDDCKGNYARFTHYTGNNIVTMGVDVGHPNIHYIINEWFVGTGAVQTEINAYSKCRILTFGKVQQFEQLDPLMRQFNVSYCIVDANPERRKAYEFSQRFPGSVRLCFYVVGISGKQLHVSDSIEPTVSVDRTSWLDVSLGRFRGETITIPYDVDYEWRKQIKALVRVYTKDKNNNPVGTYENSDMADHYSHSLCYSEIGLMLSVGIGRSQNIRNFL